MKRITDSFIKNIVRQSLNENRRLLNEEDDKVKKYDTGPLEYGGKKYSNVKVTVKPCPDGGFCFVKDISLWKAQQLGKKLSPVIGGRQGVVARGFELINTLKSNCSILQYGSVNENIANKAVEDIAYQYSITNTGEDEVKKIILSLNYPEWCKVTEIAKEKGFADEDNFWNLTTVGTDDYVPYVVNPSLEVFRKTIKNTEGKHGEFWESVNVAINESKKTEEDLLATAIKCGHKTVDEYKKSNWACEGPEYTVGGGGNSGNQVSFKGYECIIDHPALINTPIKIPQGVGYQLDTGNDTIDGFIFGVQKQGTGDTATDVGVKMKSDSKIPVQFYCETDKYIKHSLSTNVWNYSAALSGIAFDEATGKTTIVLTTDPDLEDDNKSNKSIQFENIKGFRYNLLTEVELKYVKGKLQTGPDVAAIQSKLGLPPDKGIATYGTGTKAAVEKFQKDNGLPVTGDVDETTYKAIMALKDPVVPSATGYTRDLTLKSTGPDVVAIQTRLGISTKGGFGGGTEEAVKSFQKKYKLPETGVVDKTTFDKIMAMPPAGTAAKYSGKKHNYKVGNWIKVSPKTDDPQLSGNDGNFKITQIVNEYSVAITATFVADGPGGSTQRILFGEDAKQGTQEVIKSDGDNQDNSGTGRRSTSGDNSSGRRSGTGSGTVDPEKQRQRDIRNKEYCDTLRQIKQYINNNKGGDLTVNCKRTQKTINQIMMALTGGTPAPAPTPIEEPKVSTPGGNTTVY